jgi:hypothetical protein
MFRTNSKFGTNFKLEQILNWNKYRICTIFLNKFIMWTNFEHEQNSKTKKKIRNWIYLNVNKFKTKEKQKKNTNFKIKFF